MELVFIAPVSHANVARIHHELELAAAPDLTLCISSLETRRMSYSVDAASAGDSEPRFEFSAR